MIGGRTVVQEALFYSFSIENHVPADHLLRSIDRLVDLDGIREKAKAAYAEIVRWIEHRLHGNAADFLDLLGCRLGVRTIIGEDMMRVPRTSTMRQCHEQLVA